MNSAMNLNINNNKINEIQRDEFKFDTNLDITDWKVRNPTSVVTVKLIIYKKSHEINAAVLKLLWDGVYSGITTKNKYMKLLKSNIYPNRVEYSVSVSMYCITHDVEVNISM